MSCAIYRINQWVDEHRVYPYQTWDGFAPTPEPTSNYPNQFLKNSLDSKMLLISTGEFWGYGQWGYIYCTEDCRYYAYTGSAWVYVGTASPGTQITQSSGNNQSNVDVYTDDTLTTVAFEATTTGGGQSKIRVRAMVRI